MGSFLELLQAKLPNTVVLDEGKLPSQSVLACLVKHSSGIIAAVGAALTNMIFLRPGALAVEIKYE